MLHILKLTSSFLFLLFLSCSPVPAQESLGAGKDPEPFKEEENIPPVPKPKPGGSVGIFYNPCMDGTTFAEVLARTQEFPLMRMPSQQHGEQASIQIFVNDDTQTYTIAIMNTVFPLMHPQKICVLASGTGLTYLRQLGIKI